MKYLLGFFLITLCTINAQNIRINEVVSSNSVYIDEDGDTPDWLELHNNSNQEVSLTNWTLSDDPEDPNKWTFPNIVLYPDDYLLLWASSKNRSSVSYSRTLINQGDSFKYLLPNSEPNTNWTSLDYDDTTWDSGASGFGYNDGDDATVIPYGTLSVYLRKKFTLNTIDDINSLILDIDYDDAFVAYINGVEIARANISGVPPPYNSNTFQDHEAQIYNGGNPDRFVIADYASILNVGENVLSIQAHNVSSSSSDFTIIPFLSAIFSTPNSSGIQPPGLLNLTVNNLHTNFKISSDSETLSLYDSSGQVVDQLTAENLPPNTSVGLSKTTGNLVSYLDTTPGYENSNIEFLGAIQNEVIFSEEGGLKDNAVSVALSGNTNGEIIRYEIGGEAPSNTSPIYTNPIQITSNTSVRAQLFLENYLPSPVFTESYVIGSNHDIDVVLLTTDPDDFFNEDTGIYVYGPYGTYNTSIPYFGANFWEDWERPIHFSFHDKDSDEVAKFNAGVKIYGGWSRGQNGQRSLSLFARGQYGDSKFKHSFFEELSYNKFEALVLRNSGQDWMRSSMKDIMLTSLMRGSGLDFQEHNPVATYINGSYWGMYNLREKINEHMLASKHDVDADDITLLTNNAEVIEGSNDEYYQLLNYINSTDLSIDSNFEYVAEQIDINTYALYQASNIFFNNTDWPGNNIKFWKHPEGKWRWIMYDTDFGFGPFWNIDSAQEDTLDFALEPFGPGWPNPSWSTLLFRKLVTNIGFRNTFINRYADELNTRFSTTNVQNHIDQIYATIEPEIQAHYNRWKSDATLVDNGVNIENIEGWVNYYVNQMKSFANSRPAYVKEHIKSQFNLPNFHQLTISNPSTTEGFVKVNNNLNIQELSWNGDYFETVPIELKAIAEQGYEFSFWSGDISSTDETITLDLDGQFTVTPNFRPVTNLDPIVINEINYKSNDDYKSDDWIELYNPNIVAADLSNWQVKDDDDSHVFNIPEGTTIDAEGFLVIVKDESDFISVFPDETNYIGEMDFGFGGSDSVRLFDAESNLIDEVAYLSDAPWPTCADETGYTLELKSPELDNALPENWDCFNLKGSPNAINNTGLSINDFSNNPITIYPNPTNSLLYLSKINEPFNVQIYSTLGQLVLSQANSNILEVNHLAKGMYYIKISTKNSRQTSSFVKY
jgi:hypothetical protein